MPDEIKKLSRAEIKGLKKLLGQNWKTPHLKKLTCDYQFANFQQALDFINEVGKLAETQNHHPNICIHNYKEVSIEISTHEVGGLSYKDFDLAKEIEKI